ncbi:MAG: hypothetical protein IT341_10865 [Chloroflexi bacterium]|nr:hypothetical protein [Chloroflexota bacterium]
MGRQLVRLLALQAAITMLIAGAVFVWGQSLQAVAALLGGAAAATAALAYGAAYWVQGGEQGGRPFRVFLVAEICRVGVAILLLGLGLSSLPAGAAVAFLGAFAAALMAYLLVFLF